MLAAKRVGAYFVAVAVAYVAAAFAHTQSVMNRLADLGMPVTVGVRAEASLHDLGGMATSYLPIIAVAFLIALPVGAWAIRKLPHWRPVGYALAGGAAILAIHLILRVVFDITPVAGARSTLGMTTQALCGAFGGWVFGELVRYSR